MILVINLNASVDKRYKMKDLIKGEVMRAAEVDNTPGGKGIFYWEPDWIPVEGAGWKAGEVWRRQRVGESGHVRLPGQCFGISGCVQDG